MTSGSHKAQNKMSKKITCSLPVYYFFLIRTPSIVYKKRSKNGDSLDFSFWYGCFLFFKTNLGQSFLKLRTFFRKAPKISATRDFRLLVCFLRFRKKVLVSSEKGQSVSCDLEKFNQLTLPFLIERFL